MNKNLIIFGMLILLIFVGLSGCFENGNNDEADKFEGKWRAGGCIDMGLVFNSMSMICEFTFTGETVYMEWHFAGVQETVTKSGTFEVVADELFINSEGQTFSFTYEFESYEYGGQQKEKLVLNNDISDHSGVFYKQD